MNLVHRVSAFFLIALGLLLAGNALLVWSLTRFFLIQQLDHELIASLHTLVAAVEVEDDDAKWERSDHTIALGVTEDANTLRWAVLGDHNTFIDHSRNFSPGDQQEDVALYQQLLRETEAEEVSHRFGQWRWMAKRLVAPHPKPLEVRSSDEYSEIRVVVARSAAEVEGTLQILAIMLSIFPVGMWLIAAVLGRWYCRRALHPVVEMARRARELTAADFRLRLPSGPRHDELADLSAAFNGLLDRLQQAFDQQRRFTSDAAHQLRTPLTVLLGQIDVVRRRPRTSHEYQQTLDVLRKQTEELQQIVESLLFLVQAENGASLPGVELRNSREWLADYLTRWDDHPRRGDLTVCTAGPLQVRTSWPLLSQLLDNLVGNAFKYSNPGTPVVVTLDRTDESLLIRVRDHGIGIPVEEQSSIFEPFFRSQNVRRAGIAGTGLGLSISASIARALNGRLTYAANEEGGSQFELVLHAPREASPTTYVAL